MRNQLILFKDATVLRVVRQWAYRYFHLENGQIQALWKEGFESSSRGLTMQLRITIQRVFALTDGSTVFGPVDLFDLVVHPQRPQRGGWRIHIEVRSKSGLLDAMWFNASKSGLRIHRSALRGA